VTELFAAVCSIAPTQRRRFLWAAWWSGPPARAPFRRPDAWSGGAKNPDEARRDAERAAGRPLVEIEPRWARAWARVLRGQPPWIDKPRRDDETAARRPPSESGQRESWFAVLGVPPTATVMEIKRAFRKRALETHPDRGGDASVFRRIHRAYEQALARQRRRRRR